MLDEDNDTSHLFMRNQRLRQLDLSLHEIPIAGGEAAD